MYSRSDRVASLIHAELSKMIHKEVEFLPGSLITITSVDVDKKISRAIIGITVYPSEKSGMVMRRLENKALQLQHLLLRRVNIKPMPEIVFHLDQGYERAAAMEKLLLDDGDDK